MFAMQIFIMSQQIKAGDNGRMIDKGALEWFFVKCNKCSCGSGGSSDVCFSPFYHCRLLPCTCLESPGRTTKENNKKLKDRRIPSLYSRWHFFHCRERTSSLLDLFPVFIKTEKNNLQIL